MHGMSRGLHVSGIGSGEEGEARKSIQQPKSSRIESHGEEEDRSMNRGPKETVGCTLRAVSNIMN